MQQQQTQTTTCHKNSLVVPAEALMKKQQQLLPNSNGQGRSHALTIAHRGASYHLPEHSLAAYRLALELNADFIEPDLVVSSDGVLFAMHSVDLNVTTDVAVKFPDHSWFSPHANRTGYWAFNFSWETQIQTLRLKQRLSTTAAGARTAAYDGLFGVPSLDQILRMLHEWNTEAVPATVKAALWNNSSSSSSNTEASDPTTTTHHPPPLQKYQAGLYVELKTSEWILAEAGFDLVDLLYKQIATAFSDDDDDDASTPPNDDSSTNTTSRYYWKHLLPCFESLRFDEYIVPGLVLQSFNATDLQRFHEKWHAATANNDKNDNKIAMIDKAAEPPYALLVDKPDCWEDSFWFAVGDKWRSFQSGIGCNKNCLLRSGTAESTSVRSIPDFMQCNERQQACTGRYRYGRYSNYDTKFLLFRWHSHSPLLSSIPVYI